MGPDLFVRQPWRALGFLWALPVTAIAALYYMAILGARFIRFECDDWSLHFACEEGCRGNRILAYWNVGAQTLGAAVVYSRPWLATRSVIVAHERVHVRQNLKFGPLSPVFYLLSMAIAWLYGQHPYKASAAEREARDVAGEQLIPDNERPGGGWVK